MGGILVCSTSDAFLVAYLIFFISLDRHFECKHLLQTRNGLKQLRTENNQSFTICLTDVVIF